MKKIIITVAVIIIVSLACKKHKGQYCWNQAIYNNTVIYEWDANSSASNKVQKFEDSCHCKTTTTINCKPCDGTITDIHGNDINCN